MISIRTRSTKSSRRGPPPAAKPRTPTYTILDGSNSEGPADAGDGDAPVAPYVVGTLGTVSVDQTAAPSSETVGGIAWSSLGSFTATSGVMEIDLSDSANGTVVAGGIRIVAVHQTEPPVLAADHRSNHDGRRRHQHPARRNRPRRYEQRFDLQPAERHAARPLARLHNRPHHLEHDQRPGRHIRRHGPGHRQRPPRRPT